MEKGQRDVVFTPFMLRVRAAADGADVQAPLRLRASSSRSVGHANDDWVAQRARAEQVVAEANAMLLDRTAAVDLDDEIGAGHLAFRLSRRGVKAGITLHLTGRAAFVELERSYAPSTAPVELRDVQALEDLVVELVVRGGVDG